MNMPDPGGAGQKGPVPRALGGIWSLLLPIRFLVSLVVRIVLQPFWQTVAGWCAGESLWRQKGLTGDRERFSAALEATLGDGASVKDRIQWLYNALSILDGKASGLMGFDAIVVAALSVVGVQIYEHATVEGASSSMWTATGGCVVLISLGVLLVIRAGFECLQIVRVAWSFLGGVRRSLAAGRPPADAASDELEELMREVDKRSNAFLFAWHLTVLGAWLGFLGSAIFVAMAMPTSGRSDAEAGITRFVDEPSFEGMLSADQVRSLLEGDSSLTEDALLQGLLPVAKRNAIAPVSRFEVGAAVRGESGAVYLGANFESPGLPLVYTIHAEQSAVAHAVARGETGLTKLAVTAEPCGHCRQFLNDLAGAGRLEIVVQGKPPRTLPSLLPDDFGPKDLGVEGALMAHARWPLPPQAADDEVKRAALEAAASSYAPYTRSPSGAAVELEDGRIAASPYLENAAFNPSLSPLLGALNLARFMHRPPRAALSTIKRIVLVDVVNGSTHEESRLRQEPFDRVIARHLVGQARFEVVEVEIQR